MAAKVPIRTVFDGEGNATGLAEFQSGEFVDFIHGGTGVATLGLAGQVLKVNSGGTALEYGNVEAIVDIDGATDLTGATLESSDLLLASDGGTEGRITLGQIDTLFKSTTQTLTNKTIDADNNTISNIGDTELSSGINANKIGNGDVDNTELSYLNGVTSSIQTQLNGKASTAFAIAQAIALG